MVLLPSLSCAAPLLPPPIKIKCPPGTYFTCLGVVNGTHVPASLRQGWIYDGASPNSSSAKRHNMVKHMMSSRLLSIESLHSYSSTSLSICLQSSQPEWLFVDHFLERRILLFEVTSDLSGSSR
jgi:hypothetical protein